MSEPSTAIHDEWARTFAREGYLVVERALEPSLLEGLQHDADTAMAEERERLLRGEDRHVPVSQVGPPPRSHTSAGQVSLPFSPGAGTVQNRQRRLPSFGS